MYLKKMAPDTMICNVLTHLGLGKGLAEASNLFKVCTVFHDDAQHLQDNWTALRKT